MEGEILLSLIKPSFRILAGEPREIEFDRVLNVRGVPVSTVRLALVPPFVDMLNTRSAIAAIAVSWRIAISF